MKNFIKLIKQMHEERYMKVLTEIVQNNIPIAFLSLAPIAQAVEITQNLRAQSLNITNLIVVDNTSSPANLDFDIVHVKDAEKLYPQPEYIFVMENLSARVAIKNFSASKVLSLDRTKTEKFYETFMTHLPELQEVYESLIDEESKKTFCGYWLGCITNRIDSVVYANTPHYFLEGFTPNQGDIFIDGGCYTGWTANQFAKLGCKVYSFEMNKTNFNLATKFAGEKNFVLENLGLGSHEHEARYINAKGASRLDSNGTLTTTITTLDNYVREKGLPRVDFIKLDVEGAELDILKGAKTSIARYKPILALSAYHKPDDFWTLMNFVKSIRPDYEFALRQSYETPEEEPANFNGNYINYLTSLGLEPEGRGYGECVLFAR